MSGLYPSHNVSLPLVTHSQAAHTLTGRDNQSSRRRDKHESSLREGAAVEQEVYAVA